MLIGKRPRGPIRRTTSMTGITIDHHLPNVDDDDSNQNHQMIIRDFHATAGPTEAFFGCGNNNMVDGTCAGDNSRGGLHDEERFLATMVSPRNHRRIISVSLGTDFLDAAHFLGTCGFCKRRLAPEKDIYMYRGDAAFCSLECRDEHMKEDEMRKLGKWNVMMESKKEDPHASASTTSYKASSKTETVAVA